MYFEEEEIYNNITSEEVNKIEEEILQSEMNKERSLAELKAFCSIDADTQDYEWTAKEILRKYKIARTNAARMTKKFDKVRPIY